MLEDKILQTIKQYELIKPQDTILVAVSGGPDSMCLLNSLYNMKDKLKINKLIVAHLNHMIREEAREETEYVKSFCESKNIEFYSKYVNIRQICEKNKRGEEETGREERYKFFEEISDKCNANKIAIAHNLNDNAETVLMHMMRGSGISGMAGIKPKQGKYIRPIIKCARDEIENYCLDNNLDPRYDKTNDDNKYTRNRIRNTLIPFIKDNFNPNIVETINRLSEAVSVEEDFMNTITEKSFDEVLIEKNKDKILIDLKKFNSLDNSIKSRMILYITNKLFGTSKGIEKIHIMDIIKLCNNNIGNKQLTPNKNIKVFVKSGIVSFEKVLK